jgi:microsomal dipeptidase-like Zn-dependent dipeptidase
MKKMYDLPADNWDFETGDLSGWTSTGTAFLWQPVCGNCIESARVHAISLGGDYWRTPLFTGYHGNYWICTAHAPDGEASTGTLTSREFVLTHRYICFLIAGTRDHDHIRVELQVHRADLERIYTHASIASDARLQHVASQDTSSSSNITGNTFTQKFAHLAEDEAFLILLSTTGHNSEIMRQECWNLSALLLVSQTAESALHMRIKVVDNSTRGHINVDHFQFLDYPPGPYHAPVWGFADLHCHPLAHLAYGGSLIWGKPDDDANTLQFCDGAGHGGGLISAQIIHTIESNTIYSPRRHASGPWPHFASRTHQEMHVDWVKRAYEGGLRIICASAVHNQLLEALSYARPFYHHKPEDDMSVALRQIEKLHEMANTHHKWMQVATSATDARQIIASNKVALVPALEVDFLGNWRKEEDCSTEQISALLHVLFTQGVRMITPLHLVDNAFGGCAVYDNLFNSLNHYFHGTFYQIEDGKQSGVIYYLSEQPTIVHFGWLAPRLIQSSKPLPDYQAVPAGHGHINSKGLTCRGRDLLHEMMRLGMIIDVTHMSEKTLNEMLDLVEGYQYPVVASHVAPRELGITASEVLLTRNQMERIQRLSGMIGLGTGRLDVYAAETALPQLKHTITNSCAGSSRSWAQTYLYTLAVMRGAGIALGTDFNGMVIQPGPRFAPHVTSSDALLHHSGPELPFQPQKDGVMYNANEYATPLTDAQLRTTCPPLTTGPSSAHDINVDGLAHYGMLPDFLQDVRNIGVTPGELAPLFHSAEFFLRLWETCEQRSYTI